MKVIACFAATLDGKIASKAHPKDRIGSDTDLKHLLIVRRQADAILSGGETFRQYPYVRQGADADTVPVQCILTRSFDLPPTAPVFQADPAVPILIFSPDPAPAAIRSRYPTHIEWIAFGSGSPVSAILDTLKARGVQTLLVEGGGHVMHRFLEAQAVQELYLTVCPLLLGGADNPGLVTGAGFPVKTAPRTEVLSADWQGEELYLHLTIRYPGQ